MIKNPFGTRLLSVFICVVLPVCTVAKASEGYLLHERKAADRPALLIVGVAHFANPGRDAINIKIDDVLAPKRQREIAELVDRLAAYKPTHVVVEWPIADQAELDKRYQDYRAGTYTLSRNEVDQLGLRLAAKLKLDRVNAEDWNEEPPGKEADYDFEAWTKTHGKEDALAAIFDQSVAEKQQALLARSTLTQYLCALNKPEERAFDHRHYFDIAMLGDATDNPGATWVGNWYARNLRIFANLVRWRRTKTIA